MEKLIKLLSESEYNYEVIKHEKPIASAKEGADCFGIDIGQTAPTLILSTEKGYMGLIVSGRNNKLDFEDIGIRLGIRINGLAKRDEVKKKIGFSAGEIPLIIKGIKFIIDSKLLGYDYVYIL